MQALTITGLEFSYGPTPALRGVDLSISTGQFTALLGANGAGKSTLFSLVTGLYSARAGTIEVMGHDLRKQTLAALRELGVVFQQSTLDGDLTVQQNLAYAAALQGLPRREARARIANSLTQHGLDELARRKVGSLSGGQRRRVELARALLHGPSLLLLDEPTVGLDMQSRREFVQHVKRQCEDADTGVLWATHLLDEIDPEDAVVVLHRGSRLAAGQAGELAAEHGLGSVAELFDALTAPSAPDATAT